MQQTHRPYGTQVKHLVELQGSRADWASVTVTERDEGIRQAAVAEREQVYARNGNGPEWLDKNPVHLFMQAVVDDRETDLQKVRWALRLDGRNASRRDVERAIWALKNPPAWGQA